MESSWGGEKKISNFLRRHIQKKDQKKNMEGDGKEKRRIF